MSWRTVVISNPAKLDYQNGFMYVRRIGSGITGDEPEYKQVHIDEIYMLIIETTAASLTAALLSELTKKKVKIIFCDEKRNPSSELIPYYGSHDTSIKVRNQTQWKEDIKKSVWTEIVGEKIRKQAEYLLELGNETESEMLLDYVKDIMYADESNREGHAAKVYFNALFGMDFTRTQECNINAALNYGYGIILSCFTREVSANGYITQLGLFHSNMFNQFNLACDLMEPFRVLVDRCVKKINLSKFETDEKREILRLLQNEVYINGRCEYVTNAIKIYTKSVFDALNENDLSMIKFYNNEL